MSEPRGATVLQAGRQKAYRPLPAAQRQAAFSAGVAAYEAGDHFLAHELLEPAWMGTDDPVERDLHQGLIKLAAAFVHGARGNPAGIGKNLGGARERLVAAGSAGHDALQERLGSLGLDLDLEAIVADIDARLAVLEGSPDDASIEPVALHRNRS